MKSPTRHTIRAVRHVQFVAGALAMIQSGISAAFVPSNQLLSSSSSFLSGDVSLAFRRHALPTTETPPAALLNYTDGATGMGFDGAHVSSETTWKRSNVATQNLPPSCTANGGRVTMVGSGPGDPDLLTVSAHRVLSDPTALVIADRLVSPEILTLIRGEVRVARKLPGCAERAQEEIYAWVEEGLKDGRHVVRLKIGDPFVFGRGGEEVLKFRSYGIEPTVIPGVSAAFSAPLLGSIPVTHRGVSNQVVMCTGYGRNGTSPDLIRYHKEQTVVFLMAVGRLGELCNNLVTLAGYPSKTPVAIVENAGCPSQRTVVGNMQTIATLAQEYNVKPPSTIIVGDVVNVLLEVDVATGEKAVGLVQNMTSLEMVY